MVVSEYIKILKDPSQIKKEDTQELKTILNEYPFFQSARVLYLKGLKDQDSFKYNNELKVTAAHTSDRTILFDFITSKAFHQKDKIERIANTTSEIKKEAIVSKKNIEEVSTAEEDLEIGKPLPFTPNETHSFSEWLHLTTKKPIVRIEEDKKEPSKKTIINRFIANNPKISPIEKSKTITVKISENTNHSHLMTETLAKVYLEQKKYDSAITAYEILSLKYPEKSGFFADQIKRIQILQKK